MTDPFTRAEQERVALTRRAAQLSNFEGRQVEALNGFHESPSLGLALVEAMGRGDIDDEGEWYER